MWRRGFGGRLIGRVADEQSLPHEGLALPEQALAVLIHFCPEAHFVKRALQSHMLFGALDEDDVAVAWAADALVAQGFPRDLHCLQANAGNGCESGTTTLPAIRRRRKATGHVGRRRTAEFHYRGDGIERDCLTMTLMLTHSYRDSILDAMGVLFVARAPLLLTNTVAGGAHQPPAPSREAQCG